MKFGDDSEENDDEPQDKGEKRSKNPPLADIFRFVGAGGGGEKSAMRDLPITLPSLAIAVVRVPAVMSQQDYDTLVASIQAWKPALVSQGKPAVVQSDAEDDEDFADED